MYGGSDQDELVPAALHLLNSNLFTTDWLIQNVTSEMNVRSIFVGLMTASGAVVPLWLGVAILHILVWCAVAYGIFAIAYELTRDHFASALSMLVAVLVTPIMTLGGNIVIHNMLVPEGVAWALALPGITLFLRKRWLLAGAFLGVSAWFHLLAGGLTALALVVIVLIRSYERTSGYRIAEAARLSAAFVIIALPVIIPVLLTQAGGDPDGESPFYIHAVFRNPWHHLFFSFDLSRHLRFWPLMALGGLSLWHLSKTKCITYAPEIVRFWLVVFLLCCLSIVFVELVPVEIVAKLQFFKLTVPAALIASILISAVIVRWLPKTIRGVGEQLLSWRKLGLVCALALAAIVLMLAVRGAGLPGALMYPIVHQQTELGGVEAWARTQTSDEALFAIPPSVSTFRSFGERSVVANWNAFVFSDRAMQTWYERLMAMAPIDRPARGVNPKPELDSAYGRHTVEEWLDLQARFSIDFALLGAEAELLSFPVAFENQEWVVYDLRRESESL